VRRSKKRQPMSEMGQTRPFRDVRSMSALMRFADPTHSACDVPQVPQADICNAAIALYSITSSARASSVGGTSMPSVFAVLRLITSWNLVGACTGRSPGFSPLRMRST
jgi:hypothetical protein